METIEIFLKQNNLNNKNVNEQKKELRKYLLSKRKEIYHRWPDKNTWGKNQFLSALKALNVSSQEELNAKFRVACFFPIRSELNFIPYVKPTWLFPKVSNGILLWFEYGDGQSNYNISDLKIPEKESEFCFEYKPSNKPLVCFTPGLAGDRNGYRLGYGHGYYDKFLAQNTDVISVLCLPSAQFLFDELPHENHDKKMTHIIC